MKKQISFLSFLTSAFLAYPAYSQSSSPDLPPKLELNSPAQNSRGGQDNQKKPLLSREEYEKCIQRRAKLELDDKGGVKALLELERKANEIKERQKSWDADYAKARSEVEREIVEKKRSQLNVEVLEYNKALAEQLGRGAIVIKTSNAYNNDCANRSYAIGPKAPIIVPFGPAVLPRVDKMN